MSRRAFLAWALNQLAIAWVVVLGAFWLYLLRRSGAFGIDTRIYVEAARTWLAGGNPWTVSDTSIAYAAPPTSLLPFAPLTALPMTVDVVLVSLVSLAAVGAVIARTKAGWWWVLAVPVVEGVWVGSLDPIAMALLVLPPLSGRASLVSALAPIARLFALVPLALLGQWRATAVAVAIVVITAPLLPWATYLHDLPNLIGILNAQSGDGRGALALPWLIEPTVAALFAIGRRDGAWLAIPALWPASQLHYGVFAIPVNSPVFAALAISPLRAPFAWGVIGVAVIRAIEGRLDPGSWIPNRWRPSTGVLAPRTQQP